MISLMLVLFACSPLVTHRTEEAPAAATLDTADPDEIEATTLDTGEGGESEGRRPLR
jgi:hypothetical protein